MEGTNLMKIRAFSLVELIVATAIVGILATLVTVSYSEYTVRSRDSRRKEDVHTLLAAVVQYGNVRGTTLMANSATVACTIPTGAQSLPSTPATGASCVGASGRSFGKMNLINNAVTPNPDGPSAQGSTKYTYKSSSIVDALVTAGFLGGPVLEPSRQTKGKSNNISEADYVLIRACPSGQQHVGSRGSVVAVWALLQAGIEANQSERDTLAKIPGYPLQTTIPGAAQNEAYKYEFAANQFDNAFAEVTDSNQAIRFYGVSNSINTNQSVSYSSANCGA